MFAVARLLVKEGHELSSLVRRRIVRVDRDESRCCDVLSIEPTLQLIGSAVPCASLAGHPAQLHRCAICAPCAVVEYEAGSSVLADAAAAMHACMAARLHGC